VTEQVGNEMLVTSFKQSVLAFSGRAMKVKEGDLVLVLFYFFLFIWVAVPTNTLTLISTHALF
jgi:hypothetical protein